MPGNESRPAAPQEWRCRFLFLGPQHIEAGGDAPAFAEGGLYGAEDAGDSSFGVVEPQPCGRPGEQPLQLPDGEVGGDADDIGDGGLDDAFVVLLVEAIGAADVEGVPAEVFAGLVAVVAAGVGVGDAGPAGLVAPEVEEGEGECAVGGSGVEDVGEEGLAGGGHFHDAVEVMLAHDEGLVNLGDGLAALESDVGELSIEGHGVFFVAEVGEFPAVDAVGGDGVLDGDVVGDVVGGRGDAGTFFLENHLVVGDVEVEGEGGAEAGDEVGGGELGDVLVEVDEGFVGVALVVEQVVVLGADDLIKCVVVDEDEALELRLAEGFAGESVGGECGGDAAEDVGDADAGDEGVVPLVVVGVVCGVFEDGAVPSGVGELEGKVKFARVGFFPAQHGETVGSHWGGVHGVDVEFHVCIVEIGCIDAAVEAEREKLFDGVLLDEEAVQYKGIAA